MFYNPQQFSGAATPPKSSTRTERFMRRIFFASTLALLVVAHSATGLAQPTRGATAQQTHAPARTQASTVARVSVPLPASDAVLMVDLKRLLTEAAPRALASDPARLAQLSADIEQFKSRTGVDARDFDTLAVGARMHRLPSGAMKIANVVAIARGTFSADALIEIGRASAKGKLTEQTYAGKTLYVIAVNDRIKVF